MYKTYVAADKYAALKAKRETETSEPFDVEDYPVDLNYACVPQDKEDPKNLENAHEENLTRFGLTEAGV